MAAKKISRPPERKPGIARYEKILAAAGDMIAETQSLEFLTLRDVARRAGVPRVSLYYFFPSIEALIDALYQRGLEKLMAAMPDFAPGDDWRLLMTALMDRTLIFYQKSPVEMILSLSPKSLVSTNVANQQVGREIYNLLVTRAGVPKSRKLARACEVAAEIADAVWRKAFIEHGKITPSYHEHAKGAVIRYLDGVLDELATQR